MSRPRLVALLLALATLLVYLPAAHHGFLTYDDKEYITSNRMVQAGLTWTGFRWAFTTFHAANWHPLTWLSHMTDCELFRLNAGAHHFMNVLFHAANTALLFALFWRLTERIWPSAAVAALFAWHPLHVESVAWVAERKDVLSTFFALLAFWAYVKFVKEKRRLFFWLACFLFALGLMAKPMLVTLPFVLLLLDFWPLQRFNTSTFQRLLVEKIPFFALSAVSCAVTFWAQHSGHAVMSLEVLPWSGRIEHAVLAYGLYLSKLFWPVNLAVLYPLVPNPLGVCAGAAVALVLITAVVWSLRDRQPCWLMGWLWFLGTLVPVIGLAQVGGAMIADRYTYIPSIGIFAAIAFGPPESWWSRKSVRLGAALVLLACVALTENQLRYWRDSETLFRHTLAVTKNNSIAHINLGVALDRQGRTAEALEEFRAAEKIDPESQVHFFIGDMLLKLGNPPEALAEYRTCLANTPDSAPLHNAAANALAAAGNLDGALPEFAEAERLDPHFAEPHLDLARIYLAQGEDAKARTELEAAVQSAPYEVGTLIVAARYLAANTNTTARDGPSALALAMKANELSGARQPEVFDALGMAFAATGDFSNAVICAQNALDFASVAGVKDAVPFRQRLELYENHQPWLESFRNTNAPPTR